ncbi:MAG: M15 family metallopeptidase [Flavobacteriia bacterium]|nr:M15 family metallopeptidase [Flavobacteriia bacterium]
MKNRILFILLFFLLSACTFPKSTSGDQNLPLEKDVQEEKQSISESKEVVPVKYDLTSRYPTLVDIQSVDSTIHIELKYATTDNFMGIVLYDSIDRLYVQKDVAVKLKKAQEILKKSYPELSLLIYDGVRPLSVQQKMWDALDTIPVKDRTKFVSNPKNGSIHNYGAAVDLTICDESGIPLDMGAGYDDIRKIAYPSLENEFLQKRELTEQHVRNRKLLRSVMAQAGFYNIPTEWWHFNSCTREQAKRKYQLVE